MVYVFFVNGYHSYIFFYNILTNLKFEYSLSKQQNIFFFLLKYDFNFKHRFVQNQIKKEDTLLHMSS